MEIPCYHLLQDQEIICDLHERRCGDPTDLNAPRVGVLDVWTHVDGAWCVAQVYETYIKSTAGYCVMTYLLAIGPSTCQT